MLIFDKISHASALDAFAPRAILQLQSKLSKLADDHHCEIIFHDNELARRNFSFGLHPLTYDVTGMICTFVSFVEGNIGYVIGIQFSCEESFAAVFELLWPKGYCCWKEKNIRIGEVSYRGGTQNIVATNGPSPLLNVAHIPVAKQKHVRHATTDFQASRGKLSHMLVELEKSEEITGESVAILFRGTQHLQALQADERLRILSDAGLIAATNGRMRTTIWCRTSADAHEQTTNEAELAEWVNAEAKLVNRIATSESVVADLKQKFEAAEKKKSALIAELAEHRKKQPNLSAEISTQ